MIQVLQLGNMWLRKKTRIAKYMKLHQSSSIYILYGVVIDKHIETIYINTCVIIMY